MTKRSIHSLTRAQQRRIVKAVFEAFERLGPFERDLWAALYGGTDEERADGCRRLAATIPWRTSTLPGVHRRIANRAAADGPSRYREFMRATRRTGQVPNSAACGFLRLQLRLQWFGCGPAPSPRVTQLLSYPQRFGGRRRLRSTQSPSGSGRKPGQPPAPTLRLPPPSGPIWAPQGEGRRGSPAFCH